MVRKKSNRVPGRKSLPFIEAALRGADGAQNVDQIMARICASGVEMASVTKSQTPYNTIARDIAVDIVENGERSRFVRVGPGTFRLRASATNVTKEIDASTCASDAGGPT
jgi:hypothetical protein